MTRGSHATDRSTVTRTRVWIIIVGALVGAAVGAAVALTAPTRYAASAQVGFGRVTIPTQAALARTPGIAARAVRLSGVRGVSPTTLLAHTRVTVAPDAGLVVVRVTDARRARARLLANAYAHAFVAARRARVVTAAARLRHTLGRELVALRPTLAQASGEDLFVARARYAAALRQRVALRATVTSAAHDIFIASRAQTTDRVDPPLARDAGLGLAAGVLAGALLALAAMLRPRRSRDLADALGAPVLGALPGGIALADDPRRQLRSRSVGDAIREVRSRLLLARLPGASTIAVAGATDSVHTAPTALGLAFALAEIGRRVSVVDLDTGRPPVHWWMAVPGVPGMGDVLSGHVRVDDALVGYDRGGRPLDDPDRVPSGVRLLPAGQLDGNPWDVVSSPALEGLLRRLRRDSDIVLVTCPPIVGGTSTSAVVGLADALVGIVDLQALDAADIAALRRALEDLPTTVVGAVVVQPERRRRGLVRRSRPVPAFQH